MRTFAKTTPGISVPISRIMIIRVQVCLHLLVPLKSAFSSPPPLPALEHLRPFVAVSERPRPRARLTPFKTSKMTMKKGTLVALYTCTACASHIIYVRARCYLGSSLPMRQTCQHHLVRSGSVPSRIRADTQRHNEKSPGMSGKHRVQASQATRYPADGERCCPTAANFKPMSHRPYIRADRRALRTALVDRW